MLGIWSVFSSNNKTQLDVWLVPSKILTQFRLVLFDTPTNVPSLKGQGLGYAATAAALPLAPTQRIITDLYAQTPQCISDNIKTFNFVFIDIMSDSSLSHTLLSSSQPRPSPGSLSLPRLSYRSLILPFPGPSIEFSSLVHFHLSF